MFLYQKKYCHSNGARERARSFIVRLSFVYRLGVFFVILGSECTFSFVCRWMILGHWNTFAFTACWSVLLNNLCCVELGDFLNAAWRKSRKTHSSKYRMLPKEEGVRVLWPSAITHVRNLTSAPPPFINVVDCATLQEFDKSEKWKVGKTQDLVFNIEFGERGQQKG